MNGRCNCPACSVRREEEEEEETKRTCRAPVQQEYDPRRERIPAGTISWEEHEEAWAAYAKRFGKYQSAERIAERGGFGYFELVEFLGRRPTTWQERTR